VVAVGAVAVSPRLGRFRLIHPGLPPSPAQAGSFPPSSTSSTLRFSPLLLRFHLGSGSLREGAA
jgi:hypothetical protein